ncbi:MAG: endo-1,4-beta-xylanase [Treponema sp.]|nr:endo-1,4-beta-xylanase [Treponema sp.]
MKIKIFSVLTLAFLIIGITSCATGGASSNSTAGTAQNHERFPLKTIYKDHFLVGNIINNTYTSGRHFDILRTHFNTVTAENSMKPDHLAPRERGGQYNFSNADRLLNIMTESNIIVHGHTLVWHNQTHAWMTQGTEQQVRQTMIDHINTVMAHYKGKIHSWDVVNEAVLSRVEPATNLQDWRNQLRRDSGWFRAMGPDYIELAFRTARAADPDVMLYYNDYNLDNQRKAQVVANMIKELNDKYKAEGNTRNLIDGVGMQAHYGSGTSIPNVRASIERFIELGIRIDISELDVDTKGISSGSFGPGKDTRMSDMEQRQQAIKYAELFNLFKEYSRHITRVTMWGIDDETSWKSMGNPCLFTSSLRPKQSFFAVANPNSALGL